MMIHFDEYLIWTDAHIHLKILRDLIFIWIQRIDHRICVVFVFLLFYLILTLLWLEGSARLLFFFRFVGVVW